LLFSGFAYAQSSVTLYGIVDSALLYTSKAANSSNGENAGKQFSLIDAGSIPSEFGMEGVEDLGGGLKAKFKIESGISMANGGAGISNGNFFGRQAWISLESTFGELKTGLQFSPFFLALYKLDPRGLSTFGSSSVIYADSVVATGVFESNAISYTSPVISGFQGSLLYALGGEAGNFSAGRKSMTAIQEGLPRRPFQRLLNMLAGFWAPHTNSINSRLKRRSPAIRLPGLLLTTYMVAVPTMTSRRLSM
jgi:predicted porin